MSEMISAAAEQIYEKPTAGLRFVKRPIDGGTGFVRILQQCWSITTFGNEKTTNRIEWRDVPLEEE